MSNPSPSRVNRRVKGGHCFDPSPAKVVVIDARATPHQVTVQQVTPPIRSGDGEGGRGEGATERQGCHWDPCLWLPLIRCLGKVQRQPGDELLYTVVDTLRVRGFASHGGPERPWRSWILFTETTARATPPWSRAVGEGGGLAPICPNPTVAERGSTFDGPRYGTTIAMRPLGARPVHRGRRTLGRGIPRDGPHVRGRSDPCPTSHPHSQVLPMWDNVAAIAVVSTVFPGPILYCEGICVPQASHMGPSLNSAPIPTRFPACTGLPTGHSLRRTPRAASHRGGRRISPPHPPTVPPPSVVGPAPRPPPATLSDLDRSLRAAALPPPMGIAHPRRHHRAPPNGVRQPLRPPPRRCRPERRSGRGPLCVSWDAEVTTPFCVYTKQLFFCATQYKGHNRPPPSVFLIGVLLREGRGPHR